MDKVGDDGDLGFPGGSADQVKPGAEEDQEDEEEVGGSKGLGTDWTGEEHYHYFVHV